MNNGQYYRVPDEDSLGYRPKEEPRGYRPEEDPRRYHPEEDPRRYHPEERPHEPKKRSSKKWLIVVIAVVLAVAVGVVIATQSAFAEPKGPEAVLYRFLKGLETGDYGQWQYSYSGDDFSRDWFEKEGIFPEKAAEGEWSERTLKEYHMAFENGFGNDFKMDSGVYYVMELENDDLIEFSEDMIDKYDLSPGVMYFPNHYNLYAESLEHAYYMEFYSVIEGSKGSEMLESYAVVYKYNDRWLIEPYFGTLVRMYN